MSVIFQTTDTVLKQNQTTNDCGIGDLVGDVLFVLPLPGAFLAQDLHPMISMTVMR